LAAHSPLEFCLQINRWTCRRETNYKLSGDVHNSGKLPGEPRQRRAIMLTMKSLVHAGALLALVVVILFGIGCGGGSGPTPIIPDPDPQVNIEYRLYVIESWDGGVATNSLECRQGALTPFEVRYDFRTPSMAGNWSPVAQESILDITIEGAPSGYKMPDIGLTGGQYRIRTGTCRLEFFPPVGGQAGTTHLVLKVRESGAQVRVAITILPKSGDSNPPPPPPPTCRDLHPTKEAINGYWWDCVDGVWSDTGVPVNPPPPPPDKDLFPSNGNPAGYYSGQGQQSLTLELQPVPSGVGWINWEITQGPSGAFTVPLGIPQTQCEFYYTAVGVYSVRATPFASESSFDTGGAPVGNYATFTVSITAG